jgi:flagellar basal-body rod protein FlgB
MIGDTAMSSILQKALDGTWQRQKAITNNIANAETPGYKAVKVTFEESLDKEIQKLAGNMDTKEDIYQGLQDIKDSRIGTYSDYSTSERADGNNVNMDSENIDMAKTQLQYTYLTRSMSDMFARLRYAISEGKK